MAFSPHAVMVLVRHHVGSPLLPILLGGVDEQQYLARTCREASDSAFPLRGVGGLIVTGNKDANVGVRSAGTHGGRFRVHGGVGRRLDHRSVWNWVCQCAGSSDGNTLGSGGLRSLPGGNTSDPAAFAGTVMRGPRGRKLPNHVSNVRILPATFLW